MIIIDSYQQLYDNENTTTRNLWDAAKAVVLRSKFIAILLQETGKTSNRQPNFTPKTTGKRTTTTKKKPELAEEKNYNNPSRNK